MKRRLLLIVVLIIIIIIGVALILNMKAKEDEYKNNLSIAIRQYFENEDYANAFYIIKNENGKYNNVMNIEIEKYVSKLCEDSINVLSTNKLIEFRDAGGNYVIINDAINQIEEELKRINESNENYLNAVSDYMNRNFESARSRFNAVLASDENYSTAQMYIAEIDLREKSWNNNIQGKSSYLNACAYDGEYLYIPFILNDIDGIYKVTSDGKAVDFFPLSNEPGELIINSINIVGDYLYFIAGEQVGSGYTFKSPYCIYEIKTDGSGLSLVLEGNFKDMYIKGDKVYVSSREDGLIEYNKNFEKQKTIAEGIVSEFSLGNEGLYYTLQSDLTYSSNNSVYFYDGQQSKLIDSNEYKHYYRLGEEHITYYQHNGTFEILNFGNDVEEVRIRTVDVYKVYGKIENQILYSVVGSLGRETLYSYSITDGNGTQISDTKEVIDYEIKGILYENNKLLIEENGKLYFSDLLINNRQEIVNIQSNNLLLENNMQIINHLKESDIYNDAADNQLINVIYDKQIWSYKDNELNITIEKRYMDPYDCNVYITHIFTKDYSLITTGNAKNSPVSDSTFTASEISDKYETIFAQSTDTFLHEQNADKGIIIRHGQVVRDIFLEDMFVLFEDGTAQVYEASDNINSEMLIDMGASLSFSFGPILVEDYKVNKNVVATKLSDRNPRSAIGYIEPGHYVLLASDGRDYEVSRGLTMIQAAKILEDEGCKIAYNLDGGMTTAVLFMGNYVTHGPPYGTSEWFYYRRIAEIFYVGTSELSPVDLGQFACNYEYYKNNYK